MKDVQRLHSQYLDLGYHPIPLRPLSKLPLVKGWQTRPTLSQWNGVPDNVNIGLRAGDGHAFIDCDDKNQPGTFESITKWLSGLGYETYPVVRTASGVGRHIYVNFSGDLLGSKRNLKIGAGEFYYDYGAYIVAPPSTLKTSIYTLVGGDLLTLPTLDMQDISVLINLNDSGVKKALPKMSRNAKALAAGRGFERYKSRSEAEGALILSLINSQFNYTEIKNIFDKSLSLGHYHEHKNMEWYFTQTYEKMLDYSKKESPTRRLILQLQELAHFAPWGKASDKNVFLAHLKIAYRTGKFMNGASVRDLAIIAGVSHDTATNANKRLVEKEFLVLEKRHIATFSNVFSLQVDKIRHSLSNPNVRECQNMSSIPEWKGERISIHDAFRNGKNGKLGQRAGLVYEALINQPMNIKDLADDTGAQVKTVQRALKKLSKVIDRKTGEVIEMVKQDGDKWRAKLVDLDLVAAILQTYGARGRQKEQYEIERREHARSLEKIAIGNPIQEGGQ